MTSEAAPSGTPAEQVHVRRLFVIWALLTVVGVVLIVFVAGPHMPPGNFSVQARDQRHINILLAALAVPVLFGVWACLVYIVSSFRQRGEELEDGPPDRGRSGVQIAWVITTAVIVLALGAFGSTELLGSAKGAGGGQGPNPLAVPSGPKLQVQVIGQQWAWTFRYPAYGGVETAQLALPAGQTAELHVTSLDVAHSFWAIQLGVKADAIPGNDNVTFVKPRHTGTFEIRCAELCGLWHGHMHNTGVVMAPTAFAAWIRQQQVLNAPATKTLPPYSTHYFPDPLRRAG